MGAGKEPEMACWLFEGFYFVNHRIEQNQDVKTRRSRETELLFALNGGNGSNFGPQVNVHPSRKAVDQH